jgi:hypothetical protein
MPPQKTPPTIIDLYMQAAGRSEVPKEFHFWSCLSLIASCVADRVGLVKDRKPMPPNLYIFLIGPSGVGKGTAMEMAEDLCPRLVNRYAGRTTAQYLIDRMDAGETSLGATDAATKLWLIMHELGACVGRGDQADTLIKITTDLYTGSTRVTAEGTRTSGGKEVRECSLNWLAGTTMNWLHDTVAWSAMEGGFLARVVPVIGVYDFSQDNRYVRTIYPPNVKKILAKIAGRLLRLTMLKGRFNLSASAESIDEQWYLHREPPSDELLQPWWKRQHDLTLKLAMAFSLAESPSLLIRGRHMAQAQKLSDQIANRLPDIIRHAKTNDEARDVQLVLDEVLRSKQIQHSPLLQRLSSRGITAKRLRDAVDTLSEANLIRISKTKRGGRIYSRIKRGPGRPSTRLKAAPVASAS